MSAEDVLHKENHNSVKVKPISSGWVLVFNLALVLLLEGRAALGSLECYPGCSDLHFKNALRTTEYVLCYYSESLQPIFAFVGKPNYVSKYLDSYLHLQRDSSNLILAGKIQTRLVVKKWECKTEP